METEKKKHIEDAPDPSIMTFQQCDELKSQLRQHHLEWLLVGAVLWIVSIVMLFVADLGDVRGIVALIIALVGLLPITVDVRKWRQCKRDLEGGIVEYLDGAVSTYTQSAGRNGKTFHLSVADQKFMIPKELFLSVKKGKAYRVYYAPNCRFVVGTEPL